ALGQFQLKTGGVEISLPEDALDHVDEVGAAELQRRYVDRDHQIRPVAAVEAGPSQHPLAQLPDQTGMLGNRNELRRRNLAELRMGPARQRLDADHLVAAGVDDWLIGGSQPVVLDRLVEVAFEQLAVRQVGIHRRVIDAGAVAAFVLGTVQRHIGVAQNVGGVARAAVDHRDADRRADDDVVAVDQVRRANRGDNASSDRLQRIRIRRADGDDGEFIAAEPGDEIVAAQDAAQPLRHVEDELVADRVAERVVDVLEVVEIDVEHRGRWTAAAHFGDHGFQPLAEIDAVRQAAERIVHGEMAQLRFAVGQRFGGAAHVSDHQGDEQGEAGERDGDKRRHALYHLAAGRRRLPGEARNRVAAGIGDFGDVIGWAGRRADPVQVRELKILADLAHHRFVNVFDGEYDRRLGVAGTQ